MEFDECRRELSRNGRTCAIEAKPLALMHALLLRPGEVTTREELLSAVWPGVVVTEASLTTAMAKLRSALGNQGRAVIEAVHGVGYRIAVPVVVRGGRDRTQMAFALHAGDLVPNRPQWRLVQDLAPNHGSDVWLARHDKTAERRVFKFADTVEQLDTLKREVAISRLLHEDAADRPGFVRVLEWNFDSRPFCIESVHGGPDLAAWAAAQGGLRAIPADRRLGLLARLARIVSEAHGLGVLHRDIKPGNVLLGSDRGTDDAADVSADIRLVDFGAGGLTEARRRQAGEAFDPGSNLAELLADDKCSATLRYAAPEVVAGGPATSAADIYALGVLLYQLVVGDLDRLLAPGWEDGVEHPLLRADIAEAICGDARKRLASAASLAERLETLASREAEAARDLARAAEAAALRARLHRIRSRRPWLAMLGCTILVGASGIGVAAVQAVRNGQQARREARIALQVDDFLTNDLLIQVGSSASGKLDQTLVEAADQAATRIDARFANEPAVAASIHLAMAQSFAARSGYDAGRHAFERAEADFDRAGGEARAEADITRLQQASLEAYSLEAGSLDRARSLIAAAPARPGGFPSRAAETEVWRETAQGNVELMGGSVARAEDLFRSAGRLADAIPASISQDRRLNLRRLYAYAVLRQERFDEAEALFRTLLPDEMALHGDAHPDTLRVELNLAQVLLARGLAGPAVAEFDRLYPAYVATFGPTHRQTLSLLEQRATALERLGRYDEAARDGQVLYQAAVATYGEASYLAAGLLSDLADYQCRAGRTDEGIDAARRAYRIAQSAWGEGNGGTQGLKGTAVFCLVAGRHYEEAAGLLATLDRKAAEVFMTEPDYNAQTDLAAAEIALAGGDTTQAATLLELPRRAFHDEAADPYYRRWTERLSEQVASLGMVAANAAR